MGQQIWGDDAGNGGIADNPLLASQIFGAQCRATDKCAQQPTRAGA